MTDYAPSIKAARLFEKTSAKGNVYFTGRLGAVRLTLLKSNDTGDDGSPIWNLLMSEAPARQDTGQAGEQQPRGSTSATREWLKPSQPATPHAEAVADARDEIPF